MPQPMNEPGKTNFVKVAEGAFAKKAIIRGIIDNSSYIGREVKTFKSGNPTELHFILNIEMEGGFEREFHLMGKFKRNQSEQPVSWNDFGNGVQRLIYYLSPGEVPMIQDDLSIEQHSIDALIGQEMQIISYQTNKTYLAKDNTTKYSWDLFQKVFPADTSLEDMQEVFLEDVDWLIKSRGYDPELYLKLRANKKIEEKKMEDSIPKPNDDDIPF